MFKYSRTIREEIKGEVVNKGSWTLVEIVKNTVAIYIDTETGKERTDNENETIITFGKCFWSTEEAETWMKKDKMFKSCLKAAQR